MVKTISLCLIVKNEEDRLKRCLDSYQAVVDEIVIIDTGSSDSTQDIAKKAGAKVFTTIWENDFSKARNTSLEKASCDWIVWTDADDYITPSNVDKIITIKDSFPLKTAFSFMIKNSQDGILGDVFNQIRMFPKSPKIRFRYKVHEQVLPSIQEQGFGTEYTDVMVIHTGYSGPEIVKEKQRRNLAILEQEMKERPDNPVVVYSYAGALVDLEDYDKAVPMYEKARKLALTLNREDHIADGVPMTLAALFGRRKDYGSSRKWADLAYKIDPSHPQTNCMLGELCEIDGKDEDAIRHFEFVLTCKEKPTFIPVNVNILRINACKHLGMIYKKRGDDKKAIEYLKMGVKIAGK